MAWQAQNFSISLMDQGWASRRCLRARHQGLTWIDPIPIFQPTPRDMGNEDRQFAEVAEETRQELPHRASQGACLHHQQNKSTI
jgi:hypothetical protein